ncbi:phage tail assembly chaperone [Acuticoccus sp. MNP-M23]|uniref:phage tail assembly chaperone n=1 Tax=Acuticoccus sp. MNP-M23 TaxID=3072793 RepID=UPI002814B8F3|nr:phage tail assembly chaperone [Acuticoccus sp. MNP-M23]WMS41698.1 phage tail assembly chaperone [Acuticoccus sp. MNP-M23]
MTKTAADTPQPFPWRDLMALFIGERGFAPRDFWALTLPEIEAVLGPAPSSHATRRHDLARLMEAFPDG